MEANFSQHKYLAFSLCFYGYSDPAHSEIRHLEFVLEETEHSLENSLWKLDAATLFFEDVDAIVN